MEQLHREGSVICGGLPDHKVRFHRDFPQQKRKTLSPSGLSRRIELAKIGTGSHKCTKQSEQLNQLIKENYLSGAEHHMHLDVSLRVRLRKVWLDKVPVFFKGI